MAESSKQHTITPVSFNADINNPVAFSQSTDAMLVKAYKLVERVKKFNDVIVKEKTDRCRIDALSALDQMIEKMKNLLDTHNAGMDLRNRALYSLRQIKIRVERAESINAVNLRLNDAEYIFDVLPEDSTLPI